MEKFILETKNLQKKIKQQEIIKGISLRIPRGETYGLLGPNGAGKSTIMKLITGLMKPTGGEVIFDGVPFSRESLGKIGVLIEQPALYGNLTSLENVTIHARILGVSEEETKRALKLLRMDQTGKKKASQFSMGMKQRLGIAIALLGNPQFIVLDEPTNGLDPAGIQELRKLINDLNEQGVTVLVSSHNLSEIQHISSHIAIILNGKLKYEGSIDSDVDLEEVFLKMTKEEGHSYV